MGHIAAMTGNQESRQRGPGILNKPQSLHDKKVYPKTGLNIEHISHFGRLAVARWWRLVAAGGGLPTARGAGRCGMSDPRHTVETVSRCEEEVAPCDR
jgi:hypothetical protein